MSGFVASELRELRRDLVRLDRKLAMSRLPGKVVERDPARWMVRLDLGEDPDTGEKVKGPWVRVGAGSAGAVKSSPALPAIGDEMYLESASGVIGADSVAVPGTFNDETRRPTQEADETVLIEHGDLRISAKAGEVTLKSGGSSVTLTGGGPAFAGGRITHDGKSIGSDHKHGNVQPGASQTGVPS